MTTLSFSQSQNANTEAHVCIGVKQLLTHENISKTLSVPDGASSILQLLQTDDKTDSATFYDTSATKAITYTFVKIDNSIKRNLGVLRVDQIQEALGKVPKEKNTILTLALESEQQIRPAAYAVARAFPVFTEKTKAQKHRTIHVQFNVPGTVKTELLEEVQVVCDGIREAARRVDTPNCSLNTKTYLEEIQAVVAKHKGKITSTYHQGDECLAQGMNALHAVGKAAEHGSVFALLEYKPENPAKNLKLGLVGKGIVYDTGGLSIKPTAGMCGMKGDMGGSAAILSAFDALVATNYPAEVIAILCIAENAVGPKSYKNDDIIKSLSGKTMEINNTDAEGRVVLSDGVAYCTQKINPTHMIDVCTLTGAQMVATGMWHAALLSNSKEFEDLVYEAGQATGDYTFPILYAPELLVKEFDSLVADMKNSVADRMNAQSSCAGHFIEQHFDPEWKGQWAHVDMAGPSFRKRATGYGTSLLVEVAHRLVRS